MKTRPIAAVAFAVAVAVFGAASLIAITPASAQSSDKRARVAQPDVLVVKFYADWCGKCQRMKEPLESVRAGVIAEEPALYVELDMTNERTKRQAEFLAAELGLADLWAEHGGSTGFAVLVDSDTRKVVGRLNWNMSAAEMSETIRGAL